MMKQTQTYQVFIILWKIMEEYITHRYTYFCLNVFCFIMYRRQIFCTVLLVANNLSNFRRWYGSISTIIIDKKCVNPQTISLILIHHIIVELCQNRKLRVRDVINYFDCWRQRLEISMLTEFDYDMKVWFLQKIITIGNALK